jgi:hypothetical protein
MTSFYLNFFSLWLKVKGLHSSANERFPSRKPMQAANLLLLNISSPPKRVKSTHSFVSLTAQMAAARHKVVACLFLHDDSWVFVVADVLDGRRLIRRRPSPCCGRAQKGPTSYLSQYHRLCFPPHLPTAFCVLRPGSLVASALSTSC